MSSQLSPHCSWFTDVETHGSDHIPTYTTLPLFLGSFRNRPVACTNWLDFHEAMESPDASLSDLNSFTNAIALASKTASKTFTLPCHRKCVDAQYEHLRAIRRRAERRARKTQDPADWNNARKMQKYVRRYLDKLGRARYRRFCATLDPRKPISYIWRFVKGRQRPPQQHSVTGSPPESIRKSGC